MNDVDFTDNERQTKVNHIISYFFLLLDKTINERKNEMNY